jgi:hypothetical protein
MRASRDRETGKSAIPGEKREEEDRCRVSGGRSEAAQGAVERRPDG